MGFDVQIRQHFEKLEREAEQRAAVNRNEEL
jgi:hypothetical protein